MISLCTMLKPITQETAYTLLRFKNVATESVCLDCLSVLIFC